MSDTRPPHAIFTFLSEELRELGEKYAAQQRHLRQELADIAAGVRSLKPEPPAKPWVWREPKHRRAEVGGLHREVERDVKEIVDRCLHPEHFMVLGATKPVGVVLIGPSGVGKTMLAHTVAEQLGCPKICVVSGPGLLDSYRHFDLLFAEARAEAKQNLRCVVFLDELEVLGEHRHGTRLSGLDTFKHLLVVKLMTQLEDLKGSGVLVIGATNRVDMLDPALLRSGRFEKQIYLDLPGSKGRAEILAKLRKRDRVEVATALLSQIAEDTSADGGTSGFSGADLKDLLNEAAVQAGMRGARRIEMSDLRAAIVRVRRQMHRHSVNDPENVFTRSLATFVARPGVRPGFEGVAGLDWAKQRLQLLIEPLKDPKRFEQARAGLPRGVLLSGPPGVGKTLLARATAEEARVPFFSVTASDFIEVYVGVGAARVRDTFRIARRQERCILFIDEIDAFGSRRGNGARGNEEYNHTLNELLAQLSGIEDNQHVVVMGATNRPALLDPALVRPGRLEFRIELDHPSETEREEIFNLYRPSEHQISDAARQRVLSDPRMKTGAGIASVLNAARLHALLDNKGGVVAVSDEHLERALEAFAIDGTTHDF